MQDKIKKLVVLANDPLEEYYKKGELIDRYFNPCGLFDEVHFISLTDNEIDEKKIQHTVGRAKTKIYPVGKIGFWIFVSFSSKRKKILELIRGIQPDCIRVYNAHLQGFLGATLSVDLGIPLLASLHTNPEKSIRFFLNPFIQPARWIFWKFTKYFIEPFVLNKADKIICVYSFIYDFAKGVCKEPDKIELIYNRIDMDRFKPVDRLGRGQVRILCVGRLYKQKNPEYLIRSMLKTQALLTIIGDGLYKKRLMKIVVDLDLGSKVTLIPSVPNKEIHKYYQEADIFVSVSDCKETSKVMIEAMASGLPVVVNKTVWGVPELLEDTAIITENSTDGFVKAINRLITDYSLRSDLGNRNRNNALKIAGSLMEQKEKDVYEDLLGIS